MIFHPTIGGSRTATLGVNSNAYGSPHLVPLSGIGTTPLTISPLSVAFGSVNVGLASASQQVTVKNNQSVPVTFSSVTATNDFALTPVGPTS